MGLDSAAHTVRKAQVAERHVAQIISSGLVEKLISCGQFAREDIRMCDGHTSTQPSLPNIFHGDLSKSSNVSHFLCGIFSTVNTNTSRFDFAPNNKLRLPYCISSHCIESQVIGC